MDQLKRLKRVDLLQQGFTGDYEYEYYGDADLTTLIGTGSPLSIGLQNSGDPKFQAVKSTYIQFSFYSLARFVYTEEFSLATDRDFVLRVEEAETVGGVLALKHIGYVVPQLYSEPYTKSPYPVTIVATSLGLLNNIKYQPNSGEYGEYGEYGAEFFEGEATLMTVVTRCLNKLGFGLDIWDSINTRETRQAEGTGLSVLTEIWVDQKAYVVTERERVKALSCIEVLERVLRPFVVNFFQDYGRWVIIPIELRARERAVRRYTSLGNHVETFNHDPLENRPLWIESGQLLDFKPILRDVESLYKHGRPPDAIKNSDFNLGFEILNRGFDGFIRWPLLWELSNPDHFQSVIFSQSIRDVIAPIGNEGPFAVLLDNDGIIVDDAYIKFQGTKIIDAGDGSILHIKILYAGTTYVRNLGGPVPAPTKWIDHKFRVKVGNYYLQSNGAWTLVPTDFVWQDLGDAQSGHAYSPLFHPFEGGYSSGYRELEMHTGPIPQAAPLEFRIYKPMSEDEGSSLGDTYATVAYSSVSAILYPEGLPPEESTTFFGERDVEVYADEVKYDLHHGDGPSSLHPSSFLIIGQYGALAKTEHWIRDGLSGGIIDIMINVIFQEHWTQSWTIQGLQRVRTLFDRWFHEFGRGYAPNAGQYDERDCYFDGQLVQVLNADIPSDLLPIYVCIEKDGQYRFFWDHIEGAEYDFYVTSGGVRIKLNDAKLIASVINVAPEGISFGDLILEVEVFVNAQSIGIIYKADFHNPQFISATFGNAGTSFLSYDEDILFLVGIYEISLSGFMSMQTHSNFEEFEFGTAESSILSMETHSNFAEFEFGTAESTILESYIET